MSFPRYKVCGIERKRSMAHPGDLCNFDWWRAFLLLWLNIGIGWTRPDVQGPW